jgi:hypothetical protein
VCAFWPAAGAGLLVPKVRPTPRKFSRTYHRRASVSRNLFAPNRESTFGGKLCDNCRASEGCGGLMGSGSFAILIIVPAMAVFLISLANIRRRRR